MIYVKTERRVLWLTYNMFMYLCRHVCVSVYSFCFWNNR